MPRHFLQMVVAELRAVFGRASGLGALALSLAVAALVVLGMFWGQGQLGEMQVNGMDLSSLMDLSAHGAAGYALGLRNLFILPMLIVLATASALTGEVAGRTLREDLVRPVPRWSVLAAKLLALLTLSVLTLVGTWLVAVLGGAAVSGGEFGALGAVTLGYLACCLSDLGLITLTMAVACFMRTVGGVVVSVVLGLMLDLGLRTVFKLAGMIGLDGAQSVAQLMPGEALACWEGWKSGWVVESFVGLAVLTISTMLVSVLRFQRMDLP
jgi:ABC-type transport system involved in multi-copper enzyme maturation permease subunit